MDASGVHLGGATINIADGGSPGKGSSAMPIRPAGWIGFSFNKHGTYKDLECLAHFSDGSKRKGIFDENNMVYFSGLGKEVKCEKLKILASEVSVCSSIVEKLLLYLLDSGDFFLLLIVNKESLDVNAVHDDINNINYDILITEIDKLKGAALEFSRTAILDAKIRDQYVNGIAKMSDDILKTVKSKKLLYKKVLHLLKN